MMKRIIGVFYLVILAAMFSACEKVIDVKLDGSATQIVIEGQITANAGPYQVRISETKDFEGDNNFVGRNDGVVEIKDLTSGVAETLTSKNGGVYETGAMRGMSGHTYQMTVKLSGKTYIATSTIPLEAIKVDKLYAKRFELDADKIYMVPVYTDPVGKGNYYRLRQWVNNVQIKGSFVRNDDATDGRTYDNQLYYDTDAKVGNPRINNGDLMTVELQCIDKGTYDYFRTLNATIDQNTDTPSNPLSNISGGALGVFNACQSTNITAIAKF
ncbi:hypothetical protein HDF26_000709 [Pedobacter cryoconitis]|uniref:DUF4249 domain-containing protein n=1 Tax=Pedobacter cryoconitis TaxID=188932 RepID=UPI00160CC5B9|nr:DUF4249 domain-containing protein [Pedobacter cryoconitis]MBB6270282.1 hypothetical protein [Pedobacter cryoconitis]